MKKERYYSFEDVAINEFGMKPSKKITNDKERLKKQQEKYLGTCPFCKEPCTYIESTNVVVCQNEKCKGKKIVLKNEDGFIRSLVSKDEAQAYEIDELVEKKFEGSLPAFLAAFTKHQDLSANDLDEIQQMIDRIREGGLS